MYVRDAKEVLNYFGRYRRFHEELENYERKLRRKSTAWKVLRAERQAVNFLIQGTCADLFKIAMVKANRILQGTKSRLVMTIHDELVFYMHRSELSLIKEIKESMEDWNFRVPLVADVSFTATSWDRKQEL